MGPVRYNWPYWRGPLHQVIHRHLILAVIALNLVGYLLFFLGSLPFWFPGLFAFPCDTQVEQPDAGPQCLATLAGVYMSLSCLIQFVMNFCLDVTRISSYNSIDNFYNPAPCRQIRPLKSGILLRASEGRSWSMIWVCKRLTSVFIVYELLEFFFGRVVGPSSSLPFGSW